MHSPSESNPAPGAWRLGLVLFMASLAMLFGASLIGYLNIRLYSTTAPPRGLIEMPDLLWGSTVLLLLTGGAFHTAVRAARREDPRGYRRGVIAATLLSVMFVAIQIPALISLMALHEKAIYQSRTGLQGMAAALIGLHALHVVGGLIAIAVFWRRGQLRLETDRQHAAIRACAIYWHFLEAVWIVLFGTLVITG